MLKCSSEEPMQRSEWVYSLDEVSGEIILGGDPDERLNRYSFVLKNTPGIEDVFSSIIKQIQCQIDQPMWWLLSWPKASGENYPTPARERLLKSKRLDEDWSVQELKHYTVAAKPAPNQPSQCLPDIDTWREGGWIVLFAEQIDLLGLCNQAVVPSISMLGRLRKFIAGVRFLGWLATKKFSIAYIAYGDYDKQGLVILTPVKLDLESIAKRLAIPVERIDHRFVWSV